MENTSREALDNKSLRSLDQAMQDIFHDEACGLSQGEIKKIAFQFGDAPVWDDTTKRFAAAILNFMHYTLETHDNRNEINGAEMFASQNMRDEYEEAYFHLYQRGREEFDHYRGMNEIASPSDKIYNYNRDMIDRFSERVKEFETSKMCHFVMSASTAEVIADHLEASMISVEMVKGTRDQEIEAWVAEFRDWARIVKSEG